MAAYTEPGSGRPDVQTDDVPADADADAVAVVPVAVVLPELPAVVTVMVDLLPGEWFVVVV
ncbi:MAG TPA: hypothetical protein VIM10_03840 [Actinopolymorphaceae bacterium]|jgi:hypothetical protein